MIWAAAARDLVTAGWSAAAPVLATIGQALAGAYLIAAAIGLVDKALHGADALD